MPVVVEVELLVRVSALCPFSALSLSDSNDIWLTKTPINPKKFLPKHPEDTRVMEPATARVLASQAEAIVHTGKTWPQATKRRTVD